MVFDRIYIDIVGPIEDLSNDPEDEMRYILTMMDNGSRFLRAAPIPNKDMETIFTAFLNAWASIFGFPKEFISDNDRTFDEVIKMLEDKYAKIQSTISYSPEMNPIERVHKTLMTRIKAIRHTQNLKWIE
eukprot:NODE_149_length_15530_cov_0.274448.p2 type:complete len:130 gc:universal NODE_149_length_15530_cov_0.274448:11015-11404(+)